MELTMAEKRKFLETMQELVMADVLTKEDTTLIVDIINRALFRKSWEEKPDV